MPLFEIPKIEKKEEQQTKIKLKKGQTINSLIEQAEKLVEEKLGNYKDASRCITRLEDLKEFFDNTPDDGIIGIDTETVGLNTFRDHIVGLSLCNGKDALYVPINHINPTFRTKLQNQISAEDIKELFKTIKETKHYRWVYHNAKFDLAVFRTFLGFHMPAPFWDTLIGRFYNKSR